jgi:hypothetical protein
MQQGQCPFHCVMPRARLLAASHRGAYRDSYKPKSNHLEAPPTMQLVYLDRGVMGWLVGILPCLLAPVGNPAETSVRLRRCIPCPSLRKLDRPDVLDASEGFDLDNHKPTCEWRIAITVPLGGCGLETGQGTGLEVTILKWSVCRRSCSSTSFECVLLESPSGWFWNYQIL